MIKRQFLSFLTAASLAVLGACSLEKPAFKGVDITGADYAKDFALADRIRQDLLAQGVVLKDGPGGTTWERA